jgi:hypothetical protein
MHQCPFSVAAKDQELLLTFTTLYLSQNLVVEVPRVGQVVVRHVATRRALILTPLHWGILKNFEGGRTVSAVLRQLIHARGCLPLGEFYELVVKAHGAAMLCETMDQAATAPPSRPWTWSANGTLIRRLTLAVVFIALLGLLFNRVGPPGHWWWWLTGWLLSCLGISAGFALAGGLLHAAGREITDSVEIHFAPRSAEVEMRNWLGATLEYFTQSDGGLGARMVQAVADAFRRGAQRVALLGGDCPALDADRLAMAFCPFTTRCGTGARRCGVWPDVGRGLLSACPIAPRAGALLQHSLEHSDHALGL